MNGTIVTKKGLHLITKLMAAKKTFIFTRAAVGTGKLLPNYDPSMMLDLIEYKMDGDITSCIAYAEEASATFQVSSVGIETGFFISEAGLYAEDPDEGEILYAYADMSSDPQYIYAASFNEFFQKIRKGSNSLHFPGIVKIRCLQLTYFFIKNPLRNDTGRIHICH